ncbi:dephospho-CoA kinase [Bordetella bronchialis]|uniref:Dephospho-CoA kinase n=1 Tax=Bordetella bronchialis TaxID=463025 RepID=A0A193G3X6_9BORD|nr:dephospho-CoA kinase [Bordetella bronchialis]ANN68769.1 dephospho-CoA kinase [Bordetella bronchialis]ANN73914.1 dephospho-CoA kinase [Bordetella bronchialis]
MKEVTPRLKIGLTGGIGSGKSRVADLLASWGASVIDTDEISRALTAADGGAMPEIVRAFGARAAGPDGAMDRDWMRAQVFADPQARGRLEAILHPLISRAALDAAASAAGCYVVFVVPLLIESGRWARRVDRVCVVDCDPETQIRRVRSRSGLTIDTIERIMAAQAARDTRLAAAHDVILNDGATSAETLCARTKALHDRWCALASHRATPGDTGGHP